MQPGRDAWDAAFYCGSAALLRRQALLDIGGFVAVTDIEDQATAVKLLSKGYKTRYLNEPLSVGLAAESNAVLRDQRNRWARGSLQILFTTFGPFGRGLRLIRDVLHPNFTVGHHHGRHGVVVETAVHSVLVARPAALSGV
jgi:cellulose synthase (UDP-forming)